MLIKCACTLLLTCNEDLPVMLLGPVWRDDEQLVDLPVRQLVVRVLLHTLREPTGGRCNTSRKEKQCLDPDPGGKKA